MKFERLQLRAELDRALLLVVEGVVVEEDLLQAGEVLERVLALSGDIVGGTQSPAVAGMRLRPQAERTHRRASARSVERDERIQQERNVVAPEIEIALVDLRDPRQLVQILDEAAFGIVDDLAVLAVADAGDLGQRRALGVSGDLMIELTADDEVDRRFCERFLGLHRHRRSDERDLQLRVAVLHHLRDLHVDMEAGGGGEQHEKLEVLRHRDGLLDGDAVRRRVDNLAVREHARRIAEPHRIPIRFDLARCGPAGTGAAVEAFK